MALVKKYKAEVVSLVNHFENIYTLELASKSGRFRYLPGQFLHLALDEYDPSSNWPESRCFSMQSTPNDELLKITFSAKGNFTSRMAQELRVGKIIDVKLPFGELFQQEHNTENVVFVAGGTGVTPYLSFFTDEEFSKYKNPKLYLGLRAKHFNIYDFELKKALQINPSLNVKIIYQDEDGILDISKILEENSVDSTFFISGPQAMIKTFKASLLARGVKDYNVKTDDWE
jgi:ferredoxin-NADP reductase